MPAKAVLDAQRGMDAVDKSNFPLREDAPGLQVSGRINVATKLPGRGSGDDCSAALQSKNLGLVFGK